MKWYLGASLHGGLAKTADPHRDPNAETSGRKQWKQGRGRVFQFQRKRSKTSGKRYFQNFSTLCNQQVGGSSPSTSSNLSAAQQSEYGGIPEWPKGADCKSVVSDFGGSNPPSPTKHEKSELLPCGDWVRIFCLYQGYCILILYPLALCDYRTGGFFCLKVLLEVCCRIQYNYGKNDFISEVKRM